MNVLYMTLLQGSDPSKYQLIQKIQSLQKRLIAKTQEFEERELLLQVNSRCKVIIGRVCGQLSVAYCIYCFKGICYPLSDSLMCLEVIGQLWHRGIRCTVIKLYSPLVWVF